MTTLDAKQSERRKAQQAEQLFAQARRAEYRYGITLRKVAQHIADLVQGFALGSFEQEQGLQEALRRYADALRPWAQSVATRMLADVSKRDELAWMRYTRLMARSLQDEIRNAPTGEALRQLLEQQVELITSLPLEAGQRVHQLAVESRVTGARFGELADAIMQTGQVTKSRATLIARTETARAATTLTQARAQHIGSDGYIWRTVKDSDVRPDHKRLEGTFHRWDAPPVADRRTGARAHPGAIYNCRCVAAPVIPEEF